jgi:UDP-3-O-[3-hydroxymyristoyl] N-acetylglucosamine deacetylase
VFEIERFDRTVFEEEIASARTFGFLEEVEELWRAGLARGGSLENTVVLDAEQVVNPEGLRFSDEFVRHKILDLIGDLALLGVRIGGHVRVERGGHSLHHQLVCALRDDPSAWRLEGRLRRHTGVARVESEE